MKYEKFRFADQNVYAYVSNRDSEHYITIASKFLSAPMNGKDSKVVTLCHEMSHLDDVLGTSDDGLRAGGIKMAIDGKPEALMSSYNFERYFE
ncbi:M35 family metallo-endopeptidase [Cronobacter malonaticus]|uniref:M35 family metallo-endopeptidase n=1 Tax=Cronobacter malonaticus TaxID=413503 RepID=UPI00398B6117